MEDIDLDEDTPIAFQVSQSTYSELKATLKEEMFNWDHDPRRQSPSGTESEDDEDIYPVVFKLKYTPLDRQRVRYIRARDRIHNKKYEVVPSACENRGYVFGSAEDCDVQLPEYASGYHCRIYFNRNRVWMVYDESVKGVIVNGDKISSRRPMLNAKSTKEPPLHEQVALHPEKINRLVINGREFFIKVKVHSKNFTEGRSESLVIMGRSTSHISESNSFISSSAAALLGSQDSRFARPIPPPLSYHMLDDETPVSQQKAKQLIHKWTGKLMIAKIYSKERFQEVPAHNRYDILAPLLKLHPRLLEYFDENETDFNCYMTITPQVHAYSLEAMLDREVISRQNLVLLFIHIMHALKYLHENGVIHRDVRRETILWTQEAPRGALLTGFSECCFDTTAIEPRGDTQYRAPEMNGSGFYDAKVDVFSLCSVVRSYPAPVTDLDQLVPPQKLAPEIQTLLGFGLASNVSQRYTSAQMCDTLFNLCGDEAGPPFQPLYRTRTFKLRCNWGKFGGSYKCHVQESDLWKMANFCFGIQRKEYEELAREGNRAWPSHVPFDIAERVFPPNKYSCFSTEDDPHWGRKPEAFSREYRHIVRVYYHFLSKMGNLTQLLRLTGLHLDSFFFNPSCVQEVYGASEFEGTYIDPASFSMIWDQANTLLQGDGSFLGSASRHLRDLYCTNLPEAQMPAHQERFVNTDYNEFVIVFAGYRMILVRREDGSTNLHQIQRPESAWEASVTSGFVSMEEAVLACEAQGLERIAAVLQKLGTEPPQRIIPFQRQPQPDDALQSELSVVDELDTEKTVTDWLERGDRVERLE